MKYLGWKHLVCLLFVFGVYGSANAWTDHLRDLGIDLNFVAQTRLNPQGGTLNLEAGRGFLVWGSPEHRYKYGFVRPSIKLSTAGTYNAVLAKIEVFPVSFLGFHFGSEHFENNKDYRDFECQKYECQGSFEGSFAMTNWAYALGKAFYYGSYKNSDLKRSGGDGIIFVEPASGLHFSGSQTRFSESVHVVGWKLTEKYKVSLLSQSYSGPAGQFASMNLLNVSRDLWGGVFTVGAGQFSSSEIEDRAAILLRWSKEILKKRYNKF